MEEIEKLLERFERNIADNVRNALRGNFVVASKSIEKSDEIKSKLLSLYSSLQSDRDAALENLEELKKAMEAAMRTQDGLTDELDRMTRQAPKDVNPGNGR